MRVVVGEIPPHWLSTKEAAERLGIGYRDLYRAIDRGELAASRFGSVIRIRSDHLEAFQHGDRGVNDPG